MISVCIATYNGEKYIKEQLLSILPQLGKKDEVIISDDHSTDNTLDIVKGLNDNRIKIVINNREKGYTSNFENALSYAIGDYIFLSDQDDIWMSNKVDYCIAELKEYDLVVSDAILINSKGEKIDDSFFYKRNVYYTWLGNIFKFGFLGCCMAFKMNVLKKALPFPKKHLYCAHDNWIFLVAQSFYKVKISHEKLIRYRRHTDNTSAGGFSDGTTLFFKIAYRCYLLYHLSKRSF